MPSPLFTGPASLRHPRERVSFVLTLLLAFPAAAAVGFVVHERLGISEAALFIVIAMVYVTLARGRLIGSSVMIHAGQYPRVFAIVKRACAALEIPMPLIFVREDYIVPVAALGFGEPYSLVLSSHWIEQFEDDELAFIVGRQLGHIAAGHTRYLSLLSTNGHENPIVALVFGAWIRTCEFTCDKVGLLVCGSLDAAARAIAVSSFHHFGRQVDVAQFAEQGRDIAREPVLKWGEWLGAEPYATRRIESMTRFEHTAAFSAGREWFSRNPDALPPTVHAPGSAHVTRTDCAGWWRRCAATCIDVVIIVALLGAFTSHEAPASTVADRAPITTRGHATPTVDTPGTLFTVAGARVATDGIHLGDLPLLPTKIFNHFFTIRDAPFWLGAIYLAVLVALAGQSFGMMIAGLRVVSTDFRPAGIWKSIWRYCLVFMLWPVIIMLSPLMRRVMLHDFLSGTRLIASERVLARNLTPAA